MGNRFYDSKLYHAAQFISRLMLLNILAVVCSLPVVTAGAAFSALYGALEPMVDDRGSPAVDFFRCFRKCFRRSTLHWLFFLFLAALCTGDCILVSRQLRNGPAFILFGLPVLVLILSLFTVSYLFPLMPVFRAGFLATIRISFIFSIRYLPRTVLIAVLNLIPPALVYFSTNAFVMSLPFWGLIGFALIALVITKLLKPVIAEIDRELEEAEQKKE